jgi:gliding motility-associated-like protein
LDPGPGYIAYLWQDGSTSQTYTATQEGLYWVIATDSLHCNGSDSIAMQVCAGYFYVPNAFTPNGDGRNDIFSVSTNQENITAFSFLIYSRWGQLVFETNDVRTGWDGKINRQIAPDDTYAWKIVYKVGSEGKETVMHGTVTIVN